MRVSSLSSSAVSEGVTTDGGMHVTAADGADGLGNVNGHFDHVFGTVRRVSPNHCLFLVLYSRHAVRSRCTTVSSRTCPRRETPLGADCVFEA